MITISTLSRLFALAIATFAIADAFAQARHPDSSLSEGMAYIHTARNTPKITRPNNTNIDADTLVKAEGLSIECGAKQSAVLVLSNRTALYVTENTKLEIEHFRQAIPFRSFLPEENESTRTCLRLRVDNGEVVVLSLKPPRQSRSLFSVKTKHGSFELNELESARAFSIKASENDSRFTLTSGSANFIDSNEKKFFIKNGDYCLVSNTDKASKQKVETKTFTVLEGEAVQKKLSICKIAQRSIEISVDINNNGRARKLLSPDIFIRRNQRNRSR